MMKSLFSKRPLNYSGEQLAPLFAYMNFDLIGDSILSWTGACDVHFDHMIDGEDLKVQSPIQADEMVHFIVEVFQRDLFSAVCLQRILARQAGQCLMELSTLKNVKIYQEGDDLFYKDGKLSVSIASCSSVSSQIHFGVNITNKGTPVKTSSLADLKVKPEAFAKLLMKKFCDEYNSIVFATQKVRPLGN